MSECTVTEAKERLKALALEMAVKLDEYTRSTGVVVTEAHFKPHPHLKFRTPREGELCYHVEIKATF